MTAFIRPSDYTWWLWLITACLLLAGLLVSPLYFVIAIGLTASQSVFFVAREKSLASFPAQLRLAYLLLVVVFFYPPLHFLYWIPTVGTFALVFFGYCLLARCLSLLPWNRSEPLSLSKVATTFLTPPSLDTTIQGAPATGCPGGVCSLEVQLGRRTPQATAEPLPSQATG